MDEYLSEWGIIHELTTVEAPWQNPVERDNRTVVEKLKAILETGNIQPNLWPGAAEAVVYIQNRVTNKRELDRTLIEILFGHKPEEPTADDKSAPKTIEEALSSSEAEFRKQAMEDELQSFDLHKVYTLDERKPNIKPMTLKWVFTLKQNIDGRIIRYKARLVAGGFCQRPNIDYDQTFAPIITYPTVRTIFALAA